MPLCLLRHEAAGSRFYFFRPTGVAACAIKAVGNRGLKLPGNISHSTVVGLIYRPTKMVLTAQAVFGIRVLCTALDGNWKLER